MPTYEPTTHHENEEERGGGGRSEMISDHQATLSTLDIVEAERGAKSEYRRQERGRHTIAIAKKP
ncbi:hypothetical protein ACHAWF_011324 [Thalassiosira exigua]